MSDLKELQNKVKQTTIKYGHATDPKVVLLFLLEELGEVSRAFLKELGYKKSNPRVTETAAQEMGDLFFMILRLAEVTGVDLEHELEHTFSKLQKEKSDKIL